VGTCTPICPEVAEALDVGDELIGGGASAIIGGVSSSTAGAGPSHHSSSVMHTSARSKPAMTPASLPIDRISKQDFDLISAAAAIAADAARGPESMSSAVPVEGGSADV